MRVHEIDIEKGSFAIMSSDANFSVFISDRTDKPFDRIVADRSLDKFYSHYHKYIRDCEDATELDMTYEEYTIVPDRFSFNLYDQYGLENTYIGSFCESALENCLKLRITNVDILIDEVTHFELEKAKSDAIFRLYNDSFFEYYPVQDMVKLYYMDNTESEYLSLPESDVENYLIKNWPDRKEDIKAFCDGVKSGAFQQMLYLKCNVDDPTATGVTTTIESTCVQQNGVFALSVGYIHINHHNKKEGYSRTKLDPETNLMSKDVILNKAKLVIDVKKKYHTTLGLLKLDNFDSIKAAYSDEEFKELRFAISNILHKNLANIGIAGLISDDTYMLCYTNVSNLEYLRGWIDSLQRDIRALNQDTPEKPGLTCTVSLVNYPKNARNYKEMCAILRYCLKQAETNGKDCYKIYSLEVDPPVDELVRLYGDEDFA